VTSEPGSTRIRLGGLTHPVVIAVTAGVGLISSWNVARQDPIPGWELRLTEWINDVPDAIAYLLYPFMQLGTLGGPLVAAGLIAWLTRDRVLAGATAAVGVVTWFAAKEVKSIVERGRPVRYLPDIDVREGDGTGLGYISGHSALAAASAVMVMAALPRRYRPLAALAAGLVGIARIVHGVHLPADVVGGWSFGTLMALGGLAIVDVIDRRRSTSNRSPAT
jgi:undecaprenyl-diphosphatase